MQRRTVSKRRLAKRTAERLRRRAIRVHRLLLARVSEAAQPRSMTHQKFGPPALPPEVRGEFKKPKKDESGLGSPMLAYDDAGNAPLWSFMNSQQCGLAFPGYGYLAQLTQQSEYRAPVETIATEATREWLDITVNGKASRKKRKARGEAVASTDETDADGNGVPDELDEKIEEIEARMEELKVRDHFRKLSEIDGFMGRVNLYIHVASEGRNQNEADELPLILDPATVKKGTLKAIRPVEPIWTSPYNYNSTDPTRGDFYKPHAWFVMGRRIHASRFLTFVSREVPDLLKPAYNFGGLALSQLMEPSVFQWLRARNAIAQLVFNFSVMVLATNMAAVLSEDCDDQTAQGLLDRMKLFTQSRDNQGLMALDKNTEDLKMVNVPLSGLDKLMAQFQEHMAAPSHVPLVKLTGVTPAGLNASSEGEITVWYDGVRAYQVFFFGPKVSHIIDLVQLDLYGEIDPRIGHTWRPLASPTAKELAEIRKLNSETDGNYIANGVVSPQESRERVAGDPESGYDNLSGKAPKPPQQADAEHGSKLAEGAAKKDHERGEESAENAHERQLEADKQNAKLTKQSGSK